MLKIVWRKLSTANHTIIDIAAGGNILGMEELYGNKIHHNLIPNPIY